jgi:hypothetical protein
MRTLLLLLTLEASGSAQVIELRWERSPGGEAFTRVAPSNEPQAILIYSGTPGWEIRHDADLIGRTGKKGLHRFALPPSREGLRLHLMGSGPSFALPQAWVGLERDIQEKAAQWKADRLIAQRPVLLLCSALVTGAVFFLLVPLFRPNSWEYLWFGLYLLLAATHRSVVFIDELLIGDLATAGLTLALVTCAQVGIVWPACCVTLLRSRLGWLSWFCIGLIALATAMLLLRIGPTEFLLTGVVHAAVEPLIYVDTLFRRKSREGMGPVNTALGLYLGVAALNTVLAIWGRESYYETGLQALPSFSILLFMLSMGVILNRRAAESESNRIRLEQELKAAAEVQGLLLPSGETPGVEAVYLPATEVGGDFYQVLPREDGSRVVLVGDVSGKGLRAAMLVSVAIGILRREPSSSPAAILRALNAGLTGHAGGGFVTCCCVRLGEQVTAASAGHPAPYTDGREAAIPCGLPLGIAADANYEEAVLTGSALTLVSDGVIEAANAAGELFGFDRTREISGKSAQEIAEAARVWGQNDDITVVTVRRTT